MRKSKNLKDKQQVSSLWEVDGKQNIFHGLEYKKERKTVIYFEQTHQTVDSAKNLKGLFNHENRHIVSSVGM